MTRTAILLVLALGSAAGLGLAALGYVQSNGCCCRSACPSAPAPAESVPLSAIACGTERLEAVEAPVLVLEPALVAERVDAAGSAQVGVIAPVALQSASSATSAQPMSLTQSNTALALTPTQQQAIAARQIQREQLQQKLAGKPLVAGKPGSLQAARLPKPDPMAQALAARRKHSGQPSQLDGLQQKAEAAGVQAVRPVPVK